MAEFEAKHRDLAKLLAWLEKSKGGSKEGGGKEEVPEFNSEGKQTEIKKENIPSNRELKRLSNAAVARPLTALK